MMITRVFLTAILWQFYYFLCANAAENLKSGDEYFKMATNSPDDRDSYRTKAELFWNAVLLGPGRDYKVEEAYSRFFDVFRSRHEMDEAYIFIAKEYLARGDMNTGISYCKQALAANSDSIEAYHLLARALPSKGQDISEKIQYLMQALDIDPENAETHSLLGNTYFEGKKWIKSLHHLEKAVSLDPNLLKPQANAVYLRNNLCVWGGSNGSYYYEDMKTIERIVREENKTTMQSPIHTSWQSVVFPHTALAYRVDPAVKYLAANSYARFEKAQAISRGELETDHSKLLSKYRSASVEFIKNISAVPVEVVTVGVDGESVTVTSAVDMSDYNTATRPFYRRYQHSDGTIFHLEKKKKFRIKLAFISAGMTTKAMTYLVQDMFSFFTKSAFEVHVFATTPPDPPFFINTIMKGVDWREKIKDGVEKFHDVSGKTRAEVIKMIKKIGIHILVNWDGYAQNGAKLEGLFGLHPAPVQVSHMEYMGTIGADIDYIITDQIASPLKYEQYYSEKFLYMPHSFMVNSFSYLQPEIMPPTRALPTPPTTGCRKGNPAFVFCNFNKQLKFDPIVFRMWLQALQQTENTVLCLQENPKESLKYLNRFIKEYDSSLLSRVRYTTFDHNIGPFETKKRVETTCNVVLDNYAYGAHTTAVEALWAGVPVLTFGSAMDMSGRVGCSVLTNLGLPEMIAPNDETYLNTAISLARNGTFYQNIRSRLVETCLMKEPKRHVFWDLKRYVKNMERGLEEAWFNFLVGAGPRHIFVKEEDENPNTHAVRL